jgi:hypothetical protein
VIIDVGVFNHLRKIDPRRLKQVIQSAHRRSYQGTNRITITP